MYMSPCEDPFYDQLDTYMREDSLRDQGWVKKEEVPNFEKIKTFLSLMISSGYSTGDRLLFEDCFEEIIHEFGIKIPKNDLII